MPIQLDKILNDIANEKVLHPNCRDTAVKKDVDDAWARVGKKNGLSVHELRSIFIVLQKKYEQEKIKPSSAWKLYEIMDLIHQKVVIKPIIKEENVLSLEDDETYEMLEVQEDDEQQPQQSSAVGSEALETDSVISTGGELNIKSELENHSERNNQTSNVNRSIASNRTIEMRSYNCSQGVNNMSGAINATSTATVGVAIITSSSGKMVNKNDQNPQHSSLLHLNNSTKLLNTMAPNVNRATTPIFSLTKKGITVKKTVIGATSSQSQPAQSSNNSNSTNRTIINVPGKTIQLPESLKRKLSEDQTNSGVMQKKNMIQSASDGRSTQSSSVTHTVPQYRLGINTKSNSKLLANHTNNSTASNANISSSIGPYHTQQQHYSIQQEQQQQQNSNLVQSREDIESNLTIFDTGQQSADIAASSTLTSSSSSSSSSSSTSSMIAGQGTGTGAVSVSMINSLPTTGPSVPNAINVITIPANTNVNSGGSSTNSALVNGLISTNLAGPSSSTAATVASTTSTNGFSPRFEEIDFRNDIIFGDGLNGNGVNASLSGNKVVNANATELINLGNFDNSLPPTFFKNLCNSSRYEALGLYLASVMNRLRSRSAAKLELSILRAIIEAQSEEFDQ